MRKTVLVFASVALAVLLACGVLIVEAVRPAHAAFPGTNGKIVFVQHQSGSDRDYGMKLINPNGSDRSTLIHSRVVSDPAMSPNGTSVAYAQGFGNNSEIFRINIITRKITQITNNEVYDADPSWSPDGTRIAFERGEEIDRSIENTDILARRADGTGKTVNLTNTPNEDEFAPAWSPNGKELAFHIGSRFVTQATDVFVLNLNTDQRRNLTNDGTANHDYKPNWSPDGARIVFLSTTRRDDDAWIYRIYRINASDGFQKRLLAETINDLTAGSYFTDVSYSPDGHKIAYVVNEWGDNYSSPTIKKMNASDGSDKQRIYGLPNPGSKGAYVSSLDWGDKVQR